MTFALFALRKRANELANCPAEVMEHLDAAIEILNNAKAMEVARLDALSTLDKKWRQYSVA